MNFFFGLSNKNFRDKLLVPKFKNNGKYLDDILLWSVHIKENKWKYEICDVENDDNFFYLNDVKSDKYFYFLAKEGEVNLNNKIISKKLEKFSNSTDSYPQFRANLSIELDNGGFSSYQSDYPYEMTKYVGNILCPLDVLLDKNADMNFLFFPNIYFLPIKQKKICYVIDFEKKIIISSYEIYTNSNNCIEISKDMIKPNVYFYSYEILGVPVFVTIKGKFVSLEHTHSPHHFVVGEENNKIVNNLKNQFNEIINKKNIIK